MGLLLVKWPQTATGNGGEQLLMKLFLYHHNKLLAVTVYKKGAQAVCETLTQLSPQSPASSPRGNLSATVLAQVTVEGKAATVKTG